MVFILDHLAAVVAGTVLLGALLFLQLRQQHDAIATTQRYGTEARASDFLASLQRDVENLRTPAQARAALGATRFSLRRSADGTHTTQFAFPTLLDPSLGEASDVALVVYAAEPTGSTFRITRYEYTQSTGALRATGGAEGVADFDVTLLARDGTPTLSSASIATMPARVRLEVTAAPAETPTRAAPGQQRAPAAPARHAVLAEVLALRATGGLPAVSAPPTTLPELPGDPPVVPPAAAPPPPPGLPPAPPPPPPPARGPTAPSAPAPTFPPPPAGRSI